METFIKKYAKSLGFNLVGITNADPLDELGRLDDAISSGRIAAMKWLAKAPLKRCDPRSLMPTAKSVICSALKYGENGLGQSQHVDRRRARFARGEDYHSVVRNKLEALWQEIKQKTPEANAKIAVDTSPILEKALAARAGLGWIGKNTLLVNRQSGSWFVLGVIFTDLDLMIDKPAANMCGDCVSCIDACPTSALVKANTLDANKCISYLTIENKGPIPEKINALVPDGAYGCDLCQIACPFNNSNNI